MITHSMPPVVDVPSVHFGRYGAYENVAVLVSCYNEELTVGKVVDDFRAALPGATVYVYDNNSSDRTSEVAAAHGAVVRLEPRQGKGNVVRQMHRDVDAEYYVMVDGDDTYPADAAPALLEPLLAGLADHVVGDRLSNGTYGSENKRAGHAFGNDLVRFLMRRLYGFDCSDESRDCEIWELIDSGYESFFDERIQGKRLCLWRRRV